MPVSALYLYSPLCLVLWKPLVHSDNFLFRAEGEAPPSSAMDPPFSDILYSYNQARISKAPSTVEPWTTFLFKGKNLDTEFLIDYFHISNACGFYVICYVQTWIFGLSVFKVNKKVLILSLEPRLRDFLNVTPLMRGRAKDKIYMYFNFQAYVLNLSPVCLSYDQIVQLSSKES